jgi:predicted RNA-binding Zn-ribbon protein involved in translation (DUF1610 family)
MSEEKKLHYKCTACGSSMEFAPGQHALKCPNCNAENELPEMDGQADEYDFEHAMRLMEEKAIADEETIVCVDCKCCGAEIEFPENIVGGHCPYCGTAIVAEHHNKKAIKPHYVLPFNISQEDASVNFSKWLHRLWFAPSALKHQAVKSKLSGVYLPFWTYDCETHSDYSGQRGDYYYVTETYTSTENGKTVTKTRQVRKTRWTYVCGHVHNQFDDLLIPASHSMPKNILEKLEPWNLHKVVEYDRRFLTGFSVETYAINLREGFMHAKAKTVAPIRSTIRQDIGGNEQRVHSVNTIFDDVSFKHLLLPTWLSSYKFKEKSYCFAVNAETGEVQGQRPWSWIKITLAILITTAIIAGIIIYFQSQR